MNIAIFNTIVFCALFLMWKKSSILNLVLKTIMFAGFIVNGIVLLQLSGYLVKV